MKYSPPFKNEKDEYQFTSKMLICALLERLGNSASFTYGELEAMSWKLFLRKQDTQVEQYENGIRVYIEEGEINKESIC